jgi:cobalt-zinc-cadmium efflux system outer membrane protein
MRALIAASTAALLFAGSAGGQERQTVTEVEFLAPLEGGHPALAALRQDLAEAEAAAISARTLPNPELGATREAPGSAEQLDLTVSWRPPDPGRRRLAQAAAAAGVEAARARLTTDRAGLRAAMREAFARWAVATATSAHLAGQVERVDPLARRERARAAAGETSGLDARRLALAASEARVELARAEAERLQASSVARVWRPDLPADAEPALPPLPAVGPVSTAEHPRLAALRAELEAARLTERLAARIVEMPEVVGGWQRQDAGAEVAEGPILGLAWPVPLFDRRRGERVAARARVAALEARLTLAEREMAAARSSLLAAYSQLRAAAIDASEAAADSPGVVTAATAAFQAGETALTDLLETLRSATAAEVAALELHAQALAAQRELERASADPEILPAGLPAASSIDLPTTDTGPGVPQ